VVWSYNPADTDAPTNACAPSHRYGSIAEEPCSPALESSQSPRPLKHRSVHSENSLASSHQRPLEAKHSETVE
jgi:hypothetical protein